MSSQTTVGNGRTLAGLLNEVKEELKEFLDTRLQMLKAEMKQKAAMLRMVVPMLLVAVLLAAIGCLLLTIALVAAIATLIGWGWSFLAVGVFYLLVAGATAAFALREFKAEGVAPNRTIKVLKQDQIWLQNESRSPVMTNPLPSDVLEVRAADQRRQLHNSVVELRATLRDNIREKLDVRRQARQYLPQAAGVAAFLGLLLGYGTTGIFTRR